MTRSSTARWRFIDQLRPTGEVIALFFYNLVANANAARLTAVWRFRFIVGAVAWQKPDKGGFESRIFDS